MKKVPIRILQTSDVHGYICPFNYATNQFENIGLSKLSTLIASLTTNSTILIDNGDTIQGSPLTYFLSKQNLTVSPIATVMNLMKYHYITIGNHEFNYGLDYMDSYLSNVNATILNSNIIKDNKPFYGKPYDIITIDGVKIAFIGVTTQYIPYWEQPSTIQGIDFLDAFETLSHYVLEVRNQVDLVIASYHGGFERDLETHQFNVVDTGENQGYKMLKEIEGLDILLTGHQHRTLHGKAFQTYYLQPSFNALGLGAIDILYDTETKTFTVGSTVLTDLSVSSNPTIDEEIEEVHKQTNIYLDQVVGHTDMELKIINQLDARINKHPLVSLINQIQLEYTKADISCCSLGNNVIGFSKDITIRDIIGTYIYPNTLVVKKMKGSVLLQGLEKNAEFFIIDEQDNIVIHPKFNTPKLQLYAYDMYDGLSYTINLKNDFGKRIENVLIQGNPIDLEQDYTLAMNNYRASGGGDFFFYKNSETVQDNQIEIIELLINYILEHPVLHFDHINNITIKK